MKVLTIGIMIGLALSFLVHFIMVLINGSLLIQEPNLVILWAEIVGLVTIIVFGIIRLIRSLR